MKSIKGRKKGFIRKDVQYKGIYKEIDKKEKKEVYKYIRL